ncbi:MAG: SDR family oxidoreductase [Vicinamibacterales bacterium]
MSAYDLSGRTVLVTGATAGIGLATARLLAGAGAQVIVVGRDAQRAEEAVRQVAPPGSPGSAVAFVADFTSMQAVRRLASEVRASHARLDVLINNAGAMFGERLLTIEGFERTWALNHLSCLLLTLELLPLLKGSAPARVVNVSSRTHRMGSLAPQTHAQVQKFSGLRAYSQAKLAQIMCGYVLARRLAGAGVTVNALHPGVVSTFVGREMGPAFDFMQRILLRPFASSPEQGAQTSVYLAASPDVNGVTGGYFEKCAPRRSSTASYNEVTQERVWATSVAQLGHANTQI